MSGTLTKEEQAELDALNQTGLTAAEQAELDALNGVKKKDTTTVSTTPVSQPTTPSSQSGTTNLPPITLSEETFQQGQAKSDVIKQPLRDEASYQKGRVESMAASRREEGKKLEENIAQQLKEKAEKEKQLGLKEKLLSYLKNFVGQSGEGAPVITEQPEDTTPVNAFKPFDIQIEELEPYNVREEGVDEGLRKNVLMENFKLQKAIKRDKEQLTPILQNIKTQGDINKLFGATATEVQSLAEGLKADDAKLKEDYTRARKVNEGKLQEMGFVDSFGEGIKQTVEANEVADAFYSGDEDKFGELLEKNYTKNFLYGDQKRSDLGQLLGGQALPIGATLTAAVLSGGNPVLAGISGTMYQARLGAGSEAIQVYNEALSQGKTHAQAVSMARQATKAGFVAGGVEGALGSTFAVGELVKGAMKLSKPAVKAIFAAAADAGVDAGAAMGAQYYKTAEAIKQGIKRDEFEGVTEEGAAEAVFGLGSKAGIAIAGFGFQLLAKGARKLKANTPKVYNQLITQYGKIRPDITNGTIDQAIQSGELSPDAGQQLKTDLNKSFAAQQKLEGVEIPEEKQAEVVEMQTRIDELEAQKENASPAVLPAIEKQIQDKSAELQIAAGIGLTSEEKAELNRLQTAKIENKTYDKERLKVLEKRQEAYEKVGKETANDKAKELGYSSATHLLNKVKKEGLGEYETVQEVPQEILEQINKNKPPMPEAETEGETKTEPFAEVEATTKTLEGDLISDETYNNFVDNNVVAPEILNSIAEKVIKREPLSEKETAIFSGKTSEINDIILTKSRSELQGVEQQNQSESIAEENAQPSTEERQVETPIEGFADLTSTEAVNFIDQHAVQGKIQLYAHRPDFGLSSEELTRGLKQIKEGKNNMAAAKKVLSKIQEWKTKGYVDIIAGGGGSKYAMQKISIPFELVTEVSQMTPEQTQNIGQLEKTISAKNEDLAKIVEENYTNEDGSLNTDKLAQELEEAEGGLYFGDLLGLSKEDLNELKTILNEQGNRTTEETDTQGTSEGIIEPTADEQAFARAADKKIRMAERDAIFDEAFGERSEKAKFVFKNFKNIVRDLESKGKVILEGDCF